MTTRKAELREDSSPSVVPFDIGRAVAKRTTSSSGREVVAVVTVTRFIGDDRVHAQVPVFADEVYNVHASREELKNLVPELSELLADGAVEANAYLERFAAKENARPIADFNTRL
jgi:hypothetical protein